MERNRTDANHAAPLKIRLNFACKRQKIENREKKGRAKMHVMKERALQCQRPKVEGSRVWTGQPGALPEIIQSLLPRAPPLLILSPVRRLQPASAFAPLCGEKAARKEKSDKKTKQHRLLARPPA